MEKERKHMKKKLLALLLGFTMVCSFSLLTGCGSTEEAAPEEEAAAADPAAECAALIDAIYVQEYTDETYAQCEAAKAAWDALTDEQKAQVEGEEASPDYFGADTGDASKAKKQALIILAQTQGTHRRTIR